MPATTPATPGLLLLLLLWLRTDSIGNEMKWEKRIFLNQLAVMNATTSTTPPFFFLFLIQLMVLSLIPALLHSNQLIARIHKRLIVAAATMKMINSSKFNQNRFKWAQNPTENGWNLTNNGHSGSKLVENGLKWAKIDHLWSKNPPKLGEIWLQSTKINQYWFQID